MDINKRTYTFDINKWAKFIINNGAPTPTMAAINAVYNMRTNTYMEFNDARECVHVVYEKRGYNPALDFINMLTGHELISLEDRTNLTTLITTFEEEKINKKREKKLAQKIRKNMAK
jgi:hypothetical protein